jgi:hypothetical protein
MHLGEAVSRCDRSLAREESGECKAERSSAVNVRGLFLAVHLDGPGPFWQKVEFQACA